MTDTTQTPPPAAPAPTNGSMADRVDTRSVLAIGTVGGVFGIGVCVKLVGQEVFMALLPLAGMVLGWYFGSSKSSADKDETINRQLNRGNP